MIASFATELGGRKMAITESKKIDVAAITPERIMVPISNPATIENLMDIALLLKDKSSKELIYPLTIIKDDAEVDEKISESRKMLTQAIKHASAAATGVQLVTRVDLNVPSGIIRAAKELQITTIIIGWNAKMKAREKIFGSVLDNILMGSTQTLLVCKILHPVNTFGRIKVFLPPLAHYEPGFMNWLQMTKVLAQQAGTSLEYIAPNDVVQYTSKVLPAKAPFAKATFIIDNNIPDIKTLGQKAQSGDLFIFINAKRTNISYQSYLDDIPYLLSEHFGPHSFIVVFPEQKEKSSYQSTLQLDEFSLFNYPKKRGIFSQTSKKLRKLLKFDH